MICLNNWEIKTVEEETPNQAVTIRTIYYIFKNFEPAHIN